MLSTQWLLLLIVVALILAWLEAMRVRDLALHEARRLCQSQQVQLLDETIGLAGLRLRRHDGRLKLEKRYGFEVSLDGHDRHHGHLWLAGRRVVGISTPWAGSAHIVDFPSARTIAAPPSIGTPDEGPGPRPRDPT